MIECAQIKIPRTPAHMLDSLSRSTDTISNYREKEEQVYLSGLNCTVSGSTGLILNIEGKHMGLVLFSAREIDPYAVLTVE